MQRDQQPRLAPLMTVLICSDIHISQNHYDNRMPARSFNQSSFANFALSSWTMLTTTHAAHKHASLYSSSSAVSVQVIHPTETLQPSVLAVRLITAISIISPVPRIGPLCKTKAQSSELQAPRHQPRAVDAGQGMLGPNVERDSFSSPGLWEDTVPSQLSDGHSGYE